MSVSQVIHLTGIVPPMRNIVVDGQGNILEITSNTTDNVTPRVFLNKMLDANEISLSPAVYEEYQSKIAGKDLHSTELHFALPNPHVAKTKQPGWLTALSHISLLRFPSLL